MENSNFDVTNRLLVLGLHMFFFPFRPRESSKLQFEKLGRYNPKITATYNYWTFWYVKWWRKWNWHRSIGITSIQKLPFIWKNTDWNCGWVKIFLMYICSFKSDLSWIFQSPKIGITNLQSIYQCRLLTFFKKCAKLGSFLCPGPLLLARVLFLGHISKLWSNIANMSYVLLIIFLIFFRFFQKKNFRHFYK